MKVNHTHEGSIGNLGNDQIAAAMDKLLKSFDFEKVEKSIKNLIS
jgi:argininosuccinate lyase